MIAKVTYDGHPTSWSIDIEAETEAEAVALHEAADYKKTGRTLSFGLQVVSDFTEDPKTRLAQMRKFRLQLERSDKKVDAVGFTAPRTEESEGVDSRRAIPSVSRSPA